MKSGLAFEKKVARELVSRFKNVADVKHGAWIGYLAARRTASCAQPDVVVVPYDTSLPVLVIEVKLTFKKGALVKLHEIYGPLVQALFPLREIRLIQVCKNITLDYGGELTDLDDILSAGPTAVVTWR